MHGEELKESTYIFNCIHPNKTCWNIIIIYVISYKCYPHEYNGVYARDAVFTVILAGQFVLQLFDNLTQRQLFSITVNNCCYLRVVTAIAHN